MSDTISGLSEVPQHPIPTYTEQNKTMMEQIARAQEQSRYAIAQRFPRDIETVRQNMLRECSRPSFVMPDDTKNGSSVAWYKLPKAGGIEGFTIRFAEMARQAWGHTFINIVPVGEDETQRIFMLTCVDYQTNNGGSEIVTVAKSVERSYTKDTDTVIAQRTNSKGKPVFTIIGTDDELMAKRNALNSKARRNLILELIPGWLKEECRIKMLETARKKDAEDPDAAKRKLFDAFGTVGVTVEMLTEFLGHTNQLQPAELETLRGYYGAIREGGTTWAEIMAAKDDDKDGSIAEQIEKLITASGRTPAAGRKLRSSYAGRPDELLKYLQDEAAKKNDTGAQQQAQPQAQAQQEQPAQQPAQAQPQAQAQQQAPPPAQTAASAAPKSAPPPPPPADDSW